MNLDSKYLLAIEAAINASEIILTHYKSDYFQNTKSDGSPVTQADLESSTCIKAILKKSNIPIIDEETSPEEYELRKSWSQVWLVDPLDGTKEFIKKNDEFCINIALVENEIPVFGLIASPCENKILLGSKEIGVYHFDFKDAQTVEKWTKISRSKLETATDTILIGSRSHANNIEKAFEKLFGFKNSNLDIIQQGSAIKFISMALNHANVYLRNGTTMEWDTAAGHAILNILGGKVLDSISMKPLKYNKENLKNPDFIALSSNKTHLVS